MKLLMIDNYDSFTYNLVQYFGELGAEVEVHRNDEITLDGLRDRIAAGVDRLVISPGPCTPAEAGVSVAGRRGRSRGRCPSSAYAWAIRRSVPPLAPRWSARSSSCTARPAKSPPRARGVFAGLPEKFNVNRYHSLSLERDSCPAELAITAWTYDGEIMGVRHTGFAQPVRIEGVQFHPESILTEHGHAMLKNFLE